MSDDLTAIVAEALKAGLREITGMVLVEDRSGERSRVGPVEGTRLWVEDTGQEQQP